MKEKIENINFTSKMSKTLIDFNNIKKELFELKKLNKNNNEKNTNKNRKIKIKINKCKW